MNDALLWLASAGLIVLGMVGTVLPGLPGTALLLGGIVLGAWIDNFTRIGWGTLVLVGALAIVSWVLDYSAGLIGATRAGASRLALIGAMLGTIVGVFMGFVGVLFMPLVGAAVGEFIARRDQQRAVTVGVSTWIGIMLGVLAKVVTAFVMVGIFIVALLINR